MTNEENKLVYPEVLPDGFKGFWKDGLNDEQYHGDKTAVSSTAVRLALRSPLAFYRGFVQGLDQKDSPAMKLGRIVHMAILEPDRFKHTYVVIPDFGDLRSSTNRARRDAWMADQPPGRQFMTEAEREKLMFMIDALLKHDVASNLIKGSVFEVSGYFRDPVTGLKCRIKPDVLRTDLSALPDLKTTRDASLRFFSREIWERQYYVQMAFYSFGVEQIMGRKPDIPCFIVVENCAPFDVVVYSCDEAVMERGMSAVRKGLDRIKSCLDQAIWPGLQPNGAESISLPEYTDWIAE